MQRHKHAKVIKPKKSTLEKYGDKKVIRLLDEDIKWIVEGLKSEMEEEHTSLVVRVEQVINAHKRIQQEYLEHFLELL